MPEIGATPRNDSEASHASREAWLFFDSLCVGTSDIEASITQDDKKIVKVTDLLGREIQSASNLIILNVFDDGSVEKKFIVE